MTVYKPERGFIDSEVRSLCYAFGYLAAAARGEIEPVLSRKQVRDWVKSRMTPQQIAVGLAGQLARSVYRHLERLAVKEVDR
jgi:hypothetical protein